MKLAYMVLLTLLFTDKIQTKTTPLIQNVIEGDDATLICSFMKATSVQWRFKKKIYSDGNEVNIKLKNWRRYDVVGDFRVGEYYLRIKNISKEDRGVYTCTGRNGTSYVDKKIKIKVKKRRLNEDTTLPTNATKMAKNKTMNIRVNVKGNGFTKQTIVLTLVGFSSFLLICTVVSVLKYIHCCNRKNRQTVTKRNSVRESKTDSHYYEVIDESQLVFMDQYEQVQPISMTNSKSKMAINNKCSLLEASNLKVDSAGYLVSSNCLNKKNKATVHNLNSIYPSEDAKNERQLSPIEKTETCVSLSLHNNENYLTPI